MPLTTPYGLDFIYLHLGSTPFDFWERRFHVDRDRITSPFIFSDFITQLNLRHCHSSASGFDFFEQVDFSKLKKVAAALHSFGDLMCFHFVASHLVPPACPPHN